MSELILRAFKGELLCPPDHRGTTKDKDQWYYLYGKHPKDKWSEPTSDKIAANGAKLKNGWTHHTWEQVIDFFVNEMVRIKGGLATTFFLWNDAEDKVLFLRSPCIFGNNIKNISSDNISACIPRDEMWIDRYFKKKFSVKDCVDVKCRGEHLGWLERQIISINHDSLMDSTTNNENKGNPSNLLSTANIRLFHTITKVESTITTAVNCSTGFGNDNIVVLYAGT